MITFPFLATLLRLLSQARRHSSLRELDARGLADIGVDASEFGSIEAESSGETLVTRLRIARVAHGA